MYTYLPLGTFRTFSNMHTFHQSKSVGMRTIINILNILWRSFKKFVIIQNQNRSFKNQKVINLFLIFQKSFFLSKYAKLSYTIGRTHRR